MTDHSPIERAQDAQQDAGWNACLRALSAAVDVAERVPDGRRMIGEALCAALETVGGGAPDYSPYRSLREEAEFWADIATPMELEAYAGQALRRIQRTTFAERARKRMFMTLWRSFTPKQQTDFLTAMTRDTKARGP